MNEASICDLLAASLSVLEDGLELLKIEQYIPSKMGTRNFLDILAKDKSGHWVIIEVKKTDAAAREAAHEVFKYVEAVQQHFGVRSDEIRAIVASVEWKELLVPFSRLRSESAIAIEGVKIAVDSTGLALSVTQITPVPVNQGRYLAPWHELNIYHDEASLERGIASYDKSCLEKGIEDYVLVRMRAADDFNEKAESTIREILSSFEGKVHDEKSEGEIVYERFDYVLYFSPQLLTKEFCLKLISNFPEIYEEVVASTTDMEPDAELCTLHESVYDLEPSVHRDYLEIGYAAKFANKLLVDEGWKIESILRRGTFSRNTLLSDEAIIGELSGDTGSSNRGFKRTISLGNRAHLASAKEGLAEALGTNPPWLSQINRVLDDVTSNWPGSEAQIAVFAPSAGVFTLFFMATQDATSYMPQYEILVKKPDGTVAAIYVGILIPEGAASDFQQIIEKYYEGKVGKLMLLAGFGYFEMRDVDIMEDLGIAYRTFRIDDPNGQRKWFSYRDDRWKAFNPPLPWNPLQPYFDKNSNLIASIVHEIGSRMHGGFHDLD